MRPLEQRWHELASPRRVTSALANYELTARQGSGGLSFVDVPYDPRRERHWADAARIADYASHLEAARGVVVDIGPGDGWPSLPLAAALPNARIVGVDPSPRRVAVCRANAARHHLDHARFVVGDAGALPLADGVADLVTAAASLEETNDPRAAFRELARVLRPGGVLRASYQVWALPRAEIESVALLEGLAPGDRRVLLYQYTRRTQDPARERRYVLVLPAAGLAAEVHREALEESARAPRVFGETLLEAGSPLGIPLLERLAPLAEASLVAALVRWTTPWLLDALSAAGFSEAHGTRHSGDAAREAGRRRIAAGEVPTLEAFAATTALIGRTTAREAGSMMVTAIR